MGRADLDAVSRGKLPVRTGGIDAAPGIAVPQARQMGGGRVQHLSIASQMLDENARLSSVRTQAGHAGHTLNLKPTRGRDQIGMAQAQLTGGLKIDGGGDLAGPAIGGGKRSSGAGKNQDGRKGGKRTDHGVCLKMNLFTDGLASHGPDPLRARAEPELIYW